MRNPTLEQRVLARLEEEGQPAAIEQMSSAELLRRISDAMAQASFEDGELLCPPDA